ncbi:MAG: methionyl-tRNA formyltransferase, partial [Pseudomonadota bacterium]
DPTPQPEEGVTYAEKIQKDEARMDWSRPATEVDAHIRGLSPFPGAWCEMAGERLKMLRSRVVDGQGAPGAILGGLRIACGEGAIEITELQRPGKRATSAEDFLRGATLPDRLT